MKEARFGYCAKGRRCSIYICTHAAYVALDYLCDKGMIIPALGFQHPVKVKVAGRWDKTALGLIRHILGYSLGSRPRRHFSHPARSRSAVTHRSTRLRCLQGGRTEATGDLSSTDTRCFGGIKQDRLRRLAIKGLLSIQATIFTTS